MEEEKAKLDAFCEQSLKEVFLNDFFLKIFKILK